MIILYITQPTCNEDIQTYQVEIGGPDVIPNSCDLFTWEYVAARWEN